MSSVKANGFLRTLLGVAYEAPAPTTTAPAGPGFLAGLLGVVDEPTPDVVDEPASTIALTPVLSAAPAPESADATDQPPVIPPAATVPAPTAAPADPEGVAQLADMASFDVGRRRDALRRMLTSPMTAEVVEAAAVGLGDPAIDIRYLTLQVLERAPELVAPDILDNAVLDADAAVCARALALLGRVGTPSAVAGIGERIAFERDIDVLRAGLGALASLARSTDIAASGRDEICRVVHTVAPDVVDDVSSDLRSLATALPVGEAAHRLGADEPEVRGGAALLCLHSGDAEARGALERLVTDPEPAVRRHASAALRRTTLRGRTRATTTESADDAPAADELITGLAQALFDPKPDIRQQAAEALRRVPPDRLVTWVVTEAADADARRFALIAGVAACCELELVTEPVAAAAVRLAHGGQRHRVAFATRTLPGLPAVLEGWWTSTRPAERVQAVELAMLVDPTHVDALRRALSDPNAEVRLAAVRLAAHTGAVQPLLSQLAERITEDSSQRVREAALTAFAQAPDDERVLAARAALSTPFAELRHAAMSLLDQGTDAEFAVLAEHLRDDDAQVVHRAAELVARSGRPEAFALLWDRLRTTSGDTWQVVAGILARLDRPAFRRLAAQAAAGADPVERVVGLDALATLGEGDQADRILHCLADPAVDVRVAALRALRRQATTLALDPIAATLADPEPAVRCEAIAVLGASENDSALPALVGALDDAYEEVRAAAAQSLLARPSAPLAHLLVDVLAQPAPRPAATALLSRMGEVASRALLERLADAEGELREAILAALPEEELSARLVRDLEDPDPAVRAEALATLANLHSLSALEAVIARLADPVSDVRTRAAHVLGELGDARAVHALRAAFGTDADMAVVEAVEDAYRRLSGV